MPRTDEVVLHVAMHEISLPIHLLYVYYILRVFTSLCLYMYINSRCYCSTQNLLVMKLTPNVQLL